ncbi:hypothetical protein PPSIR1_09730, partial [Plesiocystis pacifica SIR-1]
MPQTRQALLELAKLLGLLEQNGTLSWDWFVDPVDDALSLPPARRAHLGAMLRALLDDAGGPETFDED